MQRSPPSSRSRNFHEWPLKRQHSLLGLTTSSCYSQTTLQLMSRFVGCLRSLETFILTVTKQRPRWQQSRLASCTSPDVARTSLASLKESFCLSPSSFKTHRKGLVSFPRTSLHVTLSVLIQPWPRSCRAPTQLAAFTKMAHFSPAWWSLGAFLNTHQKVLPSASSPACHLVSFEG